MKKKFLLVLPLVTLVAGCGVKKTNIYELPKGGRDVNIEDEADLANFADLINEGLVKSVDALLSKVQLGLSIEHFNGSFLYANKHERNLSDEEYNNARNQYVRNEGKSVDIESVSIGTDDFNLSFDINAWGLGGKIGSINAKLDSKVSGNFSYDYKLEDTRYPEDNKHGTFNVSPKNAKLGAYFYDGVVFIDAENHEDYLGALAPIFTAAFYDFGQPNAFISLIPIVANKLSISNLIPEDALLRPINDNIRRYSTMLAEIKPGDQFAGLLNPELYPESELAEYSNMFSDMFTCRIYDDNSIGIQGTITGAEFSQFDPRQYNRDYYEIYGDGDLSTSVRKLSDDSWLTVTLLFSKDLYLSSIGVQVSADFDMEDAWFDGYSNHWSQTIEQYKFDASVGLTFNFEPPEVKLPNLDGFMELDLKALPIK